MTLIRDLDPFLFDVPIVSSTAAYAWADLWLPFTGISKMDFNLLLENIVQGTGGAGVELLPSWQLAEYRTDWPTSNNPVTGGSPVTATKAFTHFQQSLTPSAHYFIRPGIQYKLSSGTSARVQGRLHTAFTSGARALPAEEILVNPTNDTNVPNVYPLGGGRLIAASQVQTLKMAVMWMGDQNTSMEWQAAFRVFKDPLERGDWDFSAHTFQAVSTVNGGACTAELTLTGATPAPSTMQWIEPALAVRKAASNSPNTRVLLRALTTLKYSV